MKWQHIFMILQRQGLNFITEKYCKFRAPLPNQITVLLKDALHIHSRSTSKIQEYLESKSFTVKITQQRATKHGDFRRLKNG